MVLAELPGDVLRGLEGFHLAGFLIDDFPAVRSIESCHFHDSCFRYEAARVSPESAASCVSFRDAFLMLLVQILAEVRTGSHVPLDKVFLVKMNSQVCRAVRLSDLMPLVSHELVEAKGIMRECQEKVVVGYATALELHNPEVATTGVMTTQGGKEPVNVSFHFPPVRSCLMVCHAKLRYEHRESIA